jgi:hypothetical protein
MADRDFLFQPEHWLDLANSTPAMERNARTIVVLT